MPITRVAGRLYESSCIKIVEAEDFNLIENSLLREYTTWVEDVRVKVDEGAASLERGEWLDGEAVVNQILRFQKAREAQQGSDTFSPQKRVKIWIPLQTIFCTLSVLEGELVVVSPKELQRKFAKVIAPVFELIQNLGTRNSNLRKTHDLLLPKLVLGEIDVESLNSTIETDLEELVA